MSDKDFSLRQHAVETALRYVDSLLDQGISRTKAIDHAVHRFGCSRPNLVRLLNERDYGLIGNSGETEIFVVGHESGLMGTA